MSEEEKKLTDQEQQDDEDEDDYGDLPDLESVESSEYCDSDDDTDLIMLKTADVVEFNEPDSTNYAIAKAWLKSGDLLKEFEVFIIYTYSPFLYGDHVEPSYWDNQWFGWFRKANLISQRPFNLDQLSIRNIRVLEILGLTLDWCWGCFGPKQDVNYLTEILDFLDSVKDSKDLKVVISQANKLPWFTDIVKCIQGQPDDLGLSNAEFNDDLLTVELCILYGVCHLGYQLQAKNGISFQSDFAARCEAARLHSGDILNNVESAEMSFLLFERLEYLEYYRNALRLSPFDKSIYESRLQAHLISQYYLDAASDSIRLLCLQKDHKEAHLCLIKALRELNELARAEIARKKYYAHFPSPADRELLERFLRNETEISVIKAPVNSESQTEYKRLLETAVTGTGLYRKTEYEHAHLFFGVCLKKAREKPTWRYAVTWKEGSLFLLSVQYCYAQSLLSMGKHLAALDSFLKLRRYHKLYPFPAAHLYSAICFIKQRRHIEAIEYIDTGLKLCESCGYSALYWPGTPDPISECLPQNVKLKLLQLQAQILRDSSDSLATCRYSQCLNHNITTQIVQGDQDFKGYTLLKCSEKCSIAFHPQCWKRQRNCLCYTSDKSVLAQSCMTPDCPGLVTQIVLYDEKGKVKMEFASDDSKHPPVSDTSGMSTVDTRKRKGSDFSTSRAPFSESMRNKSDSDLVDKTVKPSSTTEGPSKQELSKIKSDSKLVKLDLKAAKEEPKQPQMVEDSRNSKDSVEVINRLSEEKESKSSKSKSKKRKPKQYKEEADLPKENGCKWDDLFSLPERKGLVSDADDHCEFPSWEPDPATPFCVPEHLKEKVSQFEGKELEKNPDSAYTSQRSDSTHTSESSDSAFTCQSSDSAQQASLNLVKLPDSSQTPSPPATAAVGVEMTDSSIDDFIISYFVEIFKEHGPLHPWDATLIESLQYLSEKEEYEKLIKPYGELKDFLLSMPRFKTFGNKIGLNTEEHHHLASYLKADNEPVRVVSDLPVLSEVIQTSLGLTPATTVMAPASTKGNTANTANGSVLESENMSKTVAAEPAPLQPSEQTSVSKGDKPTQDKLPRDSSLEETPLPGTVVQDTVSQEKPSQEKSPVSQDKPVSEETSSRESIPLEERKIPDLVQTQAHVDIEPLGVAKPQNSNVATRRLMIDKDVQCEAVPVEVVMTTNSATQTESSDKIMVSTGVNTDPPPVMESFKEHYDELKERWEELMKEKKSLESKLNVSEDMRAKMQRQHTRDMEKSLKKCQIDMRKEADSKIARNEEWMKEEKEKLHRERRDISEQSKAFKTDMRQLNEKLTKAKKDLQKKEKEKSDAIAALQDERDELVKRTSSTEDHFRSMLEITTKRAIDAEIQLLTERKESYVRPTEQKLQELDSLCTYASQALPGGEPELITYKDQLKQALETYKIGMEDQINRVKKKSQDLTQLESVSPPVCHMSPQLRIKAQVIQQTRLRSLQRPVGTASMSGLQPPGLTGGVSMPGAVPPVGSSVSMTTTSSGPLDQSSMLGKPGGISTFPSANPMEYQSQSGMGPTGMNMGPTGMNMGPTGMNMGPTGMNMGPTGMNMGPTGMNMGPTGMGLGPSGMNMGSGTSLGQVGMGLGPTGMNLGPTGMGLGSGAGLNQAGMGMGPTGMGLGSGAGFNQTGMGLGPTGMGMGSGTGFNQPEIGFSQASLQNSGTINQLGIGMGMSLDQQGMGLSQAGMSSLGAKMGSFETGMNMNPGGTGMMNTAGGIGRGILGAAALPSNSVGAAAASSLKDSAMVTRPNNEKRNFDQLVAKLSPLYPTYSRDDFKRAVLDLRKKLSLTGLPLEAVIEKVKEVINEKELKMFAPSLTQMSSSDSFAFSQPVLNQAGPSFRSTMPGLPVQPSQLQLEYNDDNNCIICYEDMSTNDSIKLECGHRFHIHCIRSWLNEQSTCPTCRKHALLPDDFPRLH